MVFVLLILGLFILISSANVLVAGASSIAKKFNIPNLVIGLTVVSFGTSFPELIINVLAGYNGQSDLAVGNVLGSNIVNILLVIGVSAMVRPLAVQNNTVKYEIPFSIMAILVLFVLSNDILFNGASESVLSRSDGIILMTFFLIFMYYTFIIGKIGSQQDEGHQVKTFPGWKSVLYVLGGVAGLYFGGLLIVDNATVIAQDLGLSEATIGILVIALGTSLPELATSVVAAYKGNADMAVGNVVGSNIFNVFFVLGMGVTLNPIQFNVILNNDILVVLIASILLFVFVFTRKGRQIDRVEGGIFIVLYISYVAWLLL